LTGQEWIRLSNHAPPSNGTYLIAVAAVDKAAFLSERVAFPLRSNAKDLAETIERPVSETSAVAIE